MLKLYLLGLILCVALTGCGAGTPAPSLPDSPAVTADTMPDATIQVQTTPVSNTSTPVSIVTQAPGSSIRWEGLTFELPVGHLWEVELANSIQINGVPVLGRGRITYDRTRTQPGLEVPNGIGFTIVRFTGSLQEWLDLTVAAAASGNPVNQDTVQDTTIAGRPAIAFSYTVTGTGESRTLLLKQGPDRLLVIEDHGYAEIIDNLQIEDR